MKYPGLRILRTPLTTDNHSACLSAFVRGIDSCHPAAERAIRPMIRAAGNATENARPIPLTVGFSRKSVPATASVVPRNAPPNVSSSRIGSGSEGHVPPKALQSPNATDPRTKTAPTMTHAVMPRPRTMRHHVGVVTRSGPSASTVGVPMRHHDSTIGPGVLPVRTSALTSRIRVSPQREDRRLAPISRGSRALGTAMRCATTRDKHTAVERSAVQYPGLNTPEPVAMRWPETAEACPIGGRGVVPRPVRSGRRSLPR
jgi:hypothetical protein